MKKQILRLLLILSLSALVIVTPTAPSTAKIPNNTKVSSSDFPGFISFSFLFAKR